MVARKRAKRAKRRKAEKSSAGSEKFISRKIKLTLTSLIFSLIIFVGSWVGYDLFLGSEFFESFLFILTYVSGFLSLAFFIALLIFIVLKTFRKY